MKTRVFKCSEQAAVKSWSQRCLEQQWKLANYIANLADNRWLKRAVAKGHKLVNPGWPGPYACRLRKDGGSDHWQLREKGPRNKK